MNENVASCGTVDGNSALAAGLKQRHITMISIAGVIGAGLFVGSGHAIAIAGPAVMVSYVIAGLLVVLVMRMLGEMAVAAPDTGSFSTYAHRAIGHWAGFSIGWLYWWFWVLVIPPEAIAAGAILNAWLPGIATWQFALVVTLLLTVSNFFSVAKFGEFEFWFAMLKVLAIIAFIGIGGWALLGGFSSSPQLGIAHIMSANGGFAPNGYGVIITALLTTMFSFMGTEIVTIAAAESQSPAKEIARATRAVIWRIAIFYLVSIFIVISIVPWNDPQLLTVGSYQRALEIIGIPHAKMILDLVVLIAVTSCLNSAVYTSSRMLYSLARRDDAPRGFHRVSSGGVPYMAVLGSTVVGFLIILLNYFAPERVFSFLLATSGAISLLVYLVIALSQLSLRKRMSAEGQHSLLPMWCFPWLTWAVIVFIGGCLIYMTYLPAHRAEMLATAALTIAIIAISFVSRSRRLQR